MIMLWYMGLLLIFGTLIVFITSKLRARNAVTQVRGTVCDVQRGMVIIQVEVPLMQRTVAMEFDREEIPEEFCQVGSQVIMKIKRGHAESVSLQQQGGVLKHTLHE